METRTAPSFGRTKSIAGSLPGQDTEPSFVSPADMLPDIQRADSGQTYTFKEAAELLGCGDESTLRIRYWKEKVEPAFRHCPSPLQSIARYDRNGKPVYRLNNAAIAVLRAFLAAKAEGCEDAFLLAARQQYPASVTAEPQSPSIANIAIETGNHKLILPTPELPQSYSLEGLRQTESIEIEDPLAIAAQFLEAADYLQSAMQRDIDQREQKLQKTRQAKSAIVAKAQELKLEQRLYRDRANQVAAQTSEETQSLQEALNVLQGLGKPVPADAAATG